MKRFVLIFLSSVVFSLDYYIPPEVYNDSFYNKIMEVASYPEVHSILEIGSSSGEGSTRAFIEGIKNNPSKPILFCMEVSKVRFERLKHYYKEFSQVKAYNLSSVPLKDFPTKEKISNFYRHFHSILRQYSEKEVLSWLERDIDYVKLSNVNQNGIEFIDFFDVVLIDGSEFTGEAEFQKIYGATYILLDDICAYKNFFNYKSLLKDKNYRLIGRDLKLRNGWAAFKKVL
jgi:hypothetical protein